MLLGAAGTSRRAWLPGNELQRHIWGARRGGGFRPPGAELQHGPEAQTPALAAGGRGRAARPESQTRPGVRRAKLPTWLGQGSLYTGWYTAILGLPGGSVAKPVGIPLAKRTC
jgi:hypothetical protein